MMRNNRKHREEEGKTANQRTQRIFSHGTPPGSD
jgi:hypothetical protein